MSEKGPKGYDTSVELAQSACLQVHLRWTILLSHVVGDPSQNMPIHVSYIAIVLLSSESYSFSSTCFKEFPLALTFQLACSIPINPWDGPVPFCKVRAIVDRKSKVACHQSTIEHECHYWPHCRLVNQSHSHNMWLLLLVSLK